MDERDDRTGYSVPDTGGDAAASEAMPVRIDYDGQWRDIAKIAVGNALLTLLTLGIYSFWGRTNIRRYLWSRTTINGTPLEYSGTGLQLFLGFIVIMVLFLGVNLASQFLQNALIAQVNAGDGPGIVAGLIAVVIALATVWLYLAFASFLEFRVRRYLLRQTAWNGIHLRQGGRNGAMIRIALREAALVMVSFGVLVPRMIIRTEGYAYSNSHFGDRRFGYSASPRSLYQPWLVGVLLPILAYVAVFVVIGIRVALSVQDSGDMGDAIMHNLILLPFAILFLALLLIGWCWFRAHLFNLSVSALTLGPLGFRAGIEPRAFRSAWLRYCGVLIGGFLLVGGLAALAPALLDAGGIVVMVILYGGFALATQVFYDTIVVHGLWKARVAATTVTGLLDPDTIRQAQLETQRAGEGLGQYFDAGIGEV